MGLPRRTVQVNVKAEWEKSGSDGGKQEDSNAENVDKIQMPLSEYCIGIIVREILRFMRRKL